MKQRSAMRLLLLALVTVLMLGIAPTRSAHALAGSPGTCAQVTLTVDNEGPLVVRIVIDAGGNTYVSNTQQGLGPITITFNFGPVPEGTAIHAEAQEFNGFTWLFNTFTDEEVDYKCSGGGATLCGNDDGRINPVCREPWQTAAIYCDRDHGITVYKINADSSGTFAFRATEEEILAVGGHPEVNTV